MKRITLFWLVFILSYPVLAQHTIQMRQLWTRPQVHILFEGYTVSYTIKDIDKALKLLAETGDTTFGTSCRLDTAGDFYAELYSGNHMEYHNSLQPLLQQGIGAFLLSAGHADIKNSRHKTVPAVTMNIIPPVGDEQQVYVVFYDPDTGDRVFTGKMAVAMYNKDLGLE